MHFATLVSLLSVTTLVAARCNNDGERWRDQQDARRRIDEACNRLDRQFRPGERNRICIDGREQSYRFSVTFNGNRESNIGRRECREGLEQVFRDCPRGGSERRGPFEYFADPGRDFCNGRRPGGRN